MKIIENETDWRQPISIMPLFQAFPALEESTLLTQLPEAVAPFRDYREKIVVMNDNHERLFGVYNKKTPVIEHTKLVDSLDEIYTKLFGSEPVFEIFSRKQGAQVIITADVPTDFSLDMGDGDVTNLKLILQNSYDRNLSLKLRIGLLRLVCTNGAIAGNDIGSLSTKELVEGYNTKTLAAKTFRVLDRVKSLTDVWQQWNQIEVSRAAALLTLGQKLPAKFVNPVLENADFPMSKYRLYNLMTARSTHDISDDWSRWTATSAISSIFYKDTLEKATLSLTDQRAKIPDEHIAVTVTETDALVD